MSHDEFCTVGFSIVKYRGSTEVEGEMSALLTTTHDPLCPVARSIDMNLGPSAILILCLCVPLMDARADEREKAAISERQAIEDRIVAAYQGFDVPAKLKAAIYAAVWGEQE